MSIATSLRKTSAKIQEAITGTAPKADILDTLKEEHEEVGALLKAMVETTAPAKRKALLSKVKAALVPHARAEEKVVYDAILALKGKEMKQDGEEGYLEHGLADKMIATLSKIKNAGSPEFGAAAKVLKELIEHHVKEEERDIWADVREHFSVEDRQAMNARFLAAKKTVRIPN